jgi:hypothetical protein
MAFLFSGIFWGSVLIILGLSVIINMVFHIHVPVMRIIFAVVLIYLGVRVLIGGHWCRTPNNTAMFCESNVSMSGNHNEYNVLFGKATIDTSTTAEKHIKINTIFGASTVKISKTVPTVVRVETAFGGVSLPDGNTVSFGNYTYKNKACGAASDSTTRTVLINTVFGGSTVIEE